MEVNTKDILDLCGDDDDGKKYRGTSGKAGCSSCDLGNEKDTLHAQEKVAVRQVIDILRRSGDKKLALQLGDVLTRLSG